MEWETLLSKEHFVEMEHEGGIADRNDYETIICSTFLRRLQDKACLLYTSPSPRDRSLSRMPSSA